LLSQASILTTDPAVRDRYSQRQWATQDDMDMPYVGTVRTAARASLSLLCQSRGVPRSPAPDLEGKKRHAVAAVVHFELTFLAKLTPELYAAHGTDPAAGYASLGAKELRMSCRKRRINVESVDAANGDAAKKALCIQLLVHDDSMRYWEAKVDALRRDRAYQAELDQCGRFAKKMEAALLVRLSAWPSAPALYMYACMYACMHACVGCARRSGCPIPSVAPYISHARGPISGSLARRVSLRCDVGSVVESGWGNSSWMAHRDRSGRANHADRRLPAGCPLLLKTTRCRPQPSLVLTAQFGADCPVWCGLPSSVRTTYC
jgi:hypothetical protein